MHKFPVGGIFLSSVLIITDESDDIESDERARLIDVCSNGCEL